MGNVLFVKTLSIQGYAPAEHFMIGVKFFRLCGDSGQLRSRNQMLFVRVSMCRIFARGERERKQGGEGG